MKVGNPELTLLTPGTTRRPFTGGTYVRGQQSAEMLWLLDLRLRSTVILHHHILGVQVWNRLEGVKGHQGASSMGVKHLPSVPGLQTLQHCRDKEGKLTNPYLQGRLETVLNIGKCKTNWEF